MTDPTTSVPVEEAQHGADYAPPVQDASAEVAAPVAAQLPSAEELQALIAQVQALQSELNASRGIPDNPVEAAAMNLKAHVTARVASGVAEYAELKAALDKLGDTIASKDSDLLRTIAADIRPDREGSDYVKALANDLHKNVLSAG